MVVVICRDPLLASVELQIVGHFSEQLVDLFYDRRVGRGFSSELNTDIELEGIADSGFGDAWVNGNNFLEPRYARRVRLLGQSSCPRRANSSNFHATGMRIRPSFLRSKSR